MDFMGYDDGMEKAGRKMRENRMAATAREGVPPRYRHPSATTAVGTHNNAPAASDATASQLLARASSSIATASRAAAQASPIPAKPDRRLTPPRSDKSSLTGRPSEIEVPRSPRQSRCR